MATDWISVDTAPLYRQETGSPRKSDLLWGDRCEVLNPGAQRTRVRARGRLGWVKNEHLGGTSLLELYFIDVGQGDGILIRTPDDRHVLVDGGYLRTRQPTGKNAADFVDWKFSRDYRRTSIDLDAMIASHCDADHYGGLWDLINPDSGGLDLTDVNVEAFHHAGISWWEKPGGGRWLGPHTDRVDEGADGTFFTQLVDSRASVERSVKDNADPKLQGEWADFLRQVLRARRKDGGATRVSRLSARNGHVPGFEPAPGKASIAVLAPVDFTATGGPAGPPAGTNCVRRYGATDSWNTNGNSILLRVDYGRTRILLTGDLNRRSQQALLGDLAGNRQALAADVSKGCHHGSDDVSLAFLQAIEPAATVISSGDSEGHDHPQPTIVAASGLTGHLQVEDDQLKTPLVYSTEIARSVNLGTPFAVEFSDQAGTVRYERDVFDALTVHYEETPAGALRPRRGSRTFERTQVVAGLIYGLVNVRTDGERILCATLNEADRSWNCRSFTSRF